MISRTWYKGEMKEKFVLSIADEIMRDRTFLTINYERSREISPEEKRKRPYIYTGSIITEKDVRSDIYGILNKIFSRESFSGESLDEELKRKIKIKYFENLAKPA